MTDNEKILIGVAVVGLGIFVYQSIKAATDPITKPVTGAIAVISKAITGAEAGAIQIENGIGTMWDDLVALASNYYNGGTGE